jgi:spore coat polysaccharide biosynthesis protein SpsF
VTGPVAAFIQSRMSSARFPGKALAPFRGRPLIAQVIDRVHGARNLEPARVTVLTSTHVSDDPLALYVESLGVRVYRGPLDDVLERFQRCAERSGADWIARINGDSPLMSPRIIEAVVDRADSDCDLVSTIAPRTLPRGQNPELIRTTTLLDTDPSLLSASDREHVTSCYYRHPERFRIVSLKCSRPALAEMNLSVDTVEDLHRLEAMPQAEIDDLLQVTLA